MFLVLYLIGVRVKGYKSIFVILTFRFLYRLLKIYKLDLYPYINPIDDHGGGKFSGYQIATELGTY